MTASAIGADVSLYQHPITVTQIRKAGLSFAFAKATNGAGGTDPNFAANWQAIGKSGIHRGAYHELTPGDGAAQARHFMAVVAARGINHGDMLALVASDYDVAGTEAKAFLDEVKALAGPHCPVLLYSDPAYLPRFTSCTGYPLWLAAYRSKSPDSVAPWGKWTFWQWQAGGGADGGDTDSFNGTKADLDAWIGTYTQPPAKPAPKTFEKVADLTFRPGKSSVALSWRSPLKSAPWPIKTYEIAVCEGQALGDVYQSYPRTVPKDQHAAVTWQGGSLKPGTWYTAAVRALAQAIPPGQPVPPDPEHAGPWAAVTFQTSN